MDITRLIRQGPCEWEIAPFGKMRVPAVIYVTEALMQEMDDKVYEQITNVATLPGIVKAAYAMPTGAMAFLLVASPPLIQTMVG